MATANTTITVLRGQSTDEYGDEIDIDAPVYENQPASIIEQAFTSRSRPVDGRTDQVRSYICRPISRRVELKKNDRIRDERTGEVYTVDTVNTPRNPAGHNETKAVLRRVT